MSSQDFFMSSHQLRKKTLKSVYYYYMYTFKCTILLKQTLDCTTVLFLYPVSIRMPSYGTPTLILSTPISISLAASPDRYHEISCRNGHRGGHNVPSFPLSGGSLRCTATATAAHQTQLLQQYWSKLTLRPQGMDRLT